MRRLVMFIGIVALSLGVVADVWLLFMVWSHISRMVSDV
jgi:hypothetical protein